MGDEKKPTSSTRPYEPASGEPANTPPVNETSPYRSEHPASLQKDVIPFSPPKKPGEVGVLGKYRVLKKLGQGGMGAVFLGFDPALKRRVALKVMLPSATSHTGAKERFFREARATAAIKHDNIVTVYEVGEAEGVPFMAIEYLQGISLEDYLKQRGSTGISQSMRVAREALAGLAAAHKVGLIHRDIKPANIWLEAPNGRVKILDFGLAKPLNEQGIELTKEGAILGTPAYMSPEQASGQKTDARTDLFSLGVMLYRLLAGRLPFRGDNMMAVLMALAKDEPQPLRELNPRVPPQLAEFIHGLLRKEPDKRPRSADEALKHFLTIDRREGGSHSGTKLPTTKGTDEQLMYVPIPVSIQHESVFANLEEELADETRETRTIEQKRFRQKAIVFGGIGVGVVVGGLGIVMSLLGPTKPPEDARAIREKQLAAQKQQAAGERKPFVYEEWKPDDAEWLAEFLKQPPARQMSMFTREFKRVNPEFAGNIDYQEDGKSITGLTCSKAGNSKDISPVSALAKLQAFQWFGGENDHTYTPNRNGLSDLKPLAKLPLRQLHIAVSNITDVAALAACPLERVYILHSGQLVSNEAFRNMPLRDLRVHLATDLTPFAAKTIPTLWASRDTSYDLSQLNSTQCTLLDAIFSWQKCRNSAEFLRSCKVGGIRQFGAWSPEDNLTSEMLKAIRENSNITHLHEVPKALALAAYDLEPRPLTDYWLLSPLSSNDPLPVEPKTILKPLTNADLNTTFHGGVAAWRTVAAQTQYGFPITKMIRSHKISTTDATVRLLGYTSFRSQLPEAAALVFGSNRPNKIWLNGDELEFDFPPPATPYTFSLAIVPVTLCRGDNIIMFEVSYAAQDSLGLSFGVGVATGEKLQKYLAEQHTPKPKP